MLADHPRAGALSLPQADHQAGGLRQGGLMRQGEAGWGRVGGEYLGLFRLGSGWGGTAATLQYLHRGGLGSGGKGGGLSWLPRPPSSGAHTHE